jgi:hypothetical protein
VCRKYRIKYICDYYVILVKTKSRDFSNTDLTFYFLFLVGSTSKILKIYNIYLYI